MVFTSLRFILIFLLSLSPLSALNTEYNLLHNPGFEQGLDGWDIDSSTRAQLTKNRHSGQNALSYTQGGIGQSIDLTTTPNGQTAYILSGYYKNRGAVDGMWMGVVCSDAAWNTLDEYSISLQNSYQFLPFAMVFTPPPNTAHITYWTWSEAPAGGKTILDDIALYTKNVQPDNHMPVLNDIPDQLYTLGEAVNLQFSASDSDGDRLTFLIDGLPQEADLYLDPLSGKLTGTASPTGKYPLTLYVIDNQGGVAQKSFLWEVQAAPVSACNILQNPGFESNTYGWNTYGKSIQRVSSAYSGDFALSIQAGGLDQMSQKITTGPDTYQFNGYYKFTGDITGAWAGVIFYDQKQKAIASQTISLDYTNVYTPFTVNATSSDKTSYIQVWVWTEGDGQVFLDDLKLSTSACYTYVIPSSLPPGGIPVDKAPQFVVIGFDDNTKAEGIDWAIDLFKDRKNPDGSEARVSFYMNTKGLHEWIEDDPTNLAAAMQRLANSGHEIGNHTYCHHGDIVANTWDAFIRTVLDLNQSQWQTKLSAATNDLTNLTGVSAERIYGFRAPYLLYNQAMLEAVRAEGFVYDCSIEEGYAENFDGSNFRWPYQLDQGSPGHNESWFGNPVNPNSVTISSIHGLWELPNHVLIVPKDSDCTRYGIKPGLWSRIKAKIPYLENYKITGFDYNLWSEAALSKEDVLGILKYNLDLRLAGNRAPLMFGAHTQYYTESWANRNAPNATATQMRAAISEFIDYALSKPDVRIRPGIDIIRWCDSPTPLP